MSASNKGLPSNLQAINDRLVLKHAQLQEDRKSFLEFNAMASKESDPTKASLLSDTAKKLRLAFNEASMIDASKDLEVAVPFNRVSRVCKALASSFKRICADACPMEARVLVLVKVGTQHVLNIGERSAVQRQGNLSCANVNLFQAALRIKNPLRQLL